MKILKEDLQSKKTVIASTKTACLLAGECQSENIVYQATVNSDKPNYEPKIYIGLTETKFKIRYANQRKSFNHQVHGNEIELSKEV